jgi:hypothetical protein
MFGNGKRWSVFGLLLACSLALLGFFGAWNQFAMRITGSGTNASPSTSMELYRVNLRYQMPAKRVGEPSKLLQWELDVPRAYVFDENGRNGEAYIPGRGAETQYAIVLRILADSTLTKFAPDTITNSKSDGVRDFILFLGNSPSSLKTRYIVKNDLCTSKDITISPCTERDYRCSVRFQVDGWVISGAVTRDLFQRPEQTCSMAKKFLNQYTIKRDDAQALLGDAP